MRASIPSIKGTKTSLKYLIAIIVAPLLFWVIYAAHFLNQGPEIGTGFIAGDFLYYSANGREVFEAGNGFAYPNPYADSGPIIYFHLFYYILGFGIKVLGLDPGYQFAAIGLICGLLESYLMFLIINAILPSRRFIIPLFLMVMWGGSVFVLSSVVYDVMTGSAPSGKLFMFDPFDGEWGLNWGRSLLYPAETFYHMIFSATWYALLKRKWELSLGGVLLLATSTPFTGVQILLIIITFFTFMFFREREKQFLLYAGTAFLILALLFLYYFGFLKSFEQHSFIHENITLGTWIVPWDSFLIAYLPVGIFATWRLTKDVASFSYREWLFAISFLVSAGLAKNDLLLNHPIQPVHFTRGYVWAPLMLIALPLLQRFFIRLYDSRQRIFANTVFMLMFLIVILDNFAYLKWRATELGFGVSLSTDERLMFKWMDEANLEGVLLSGNYMRSYISATYTGITPYLGHWLLTPDFALRSRQVWECMNTGQGGEWLGQIDYVLSEKEKFPPCLEMEDWKFVHEAQELALFQRKSNESRKSDGEGVTSGQ